MTPALPILEVSRSHDGWVLVIDAGGMSTWRLRPWAAQFLALRIAAGFVARQEICRGQAAVGHSADDMVSFAWPRERAEQAALDLSRAAMLCRLHPTGGPP